ncbi:MAG: rnr, partial [Chlamydiia bacterium]|nr:rnr [Chlamydiia bacterium]
IFDQVLKNLKEDGKIIIHQEKYIPAEELLPTQKLIKGMVRVHHRGFGFVAVEGSNEPDIFIPKPYMNGAIDGDTVEVLVDLSSLSEKGPEGKVNSILDRKRKQLVAIIAKITAKEALGYSSLLGERNLATLPLGDEPLEVGDRVLLDVLEWGSAKEPTKATLSRKLGHISDPTTDIGVAILEYGIREQFPEAAAEEALSFGTKVSAKDIEGREDLRETECLTIDPDTAKDFDDAISLEQLDNKYILGIHIADVSHYVRPGSALDREARIRCNSTYFPGKCIPMLPHELSDNLCSLKEGVARLTVSVFVEIGKDGNILGTRISRTVIKSQKRFTYKQAKQVLDGTLRSKHQETLQEMVKVCQLLKKKRAERGSVELYMPELVILIDQSGVPTGTEIVQYDITHQMVEEFMLLANETVAKHLAKEGKELTYRVHEEPSKESLREFAVLAEAFGHKLSYDPTPQDIQKFFAEVEGSPFAQYLATCYIRSMRLACYSADNIGHYGLSLQHYCHFTSPIRRYVDTIAHRLLFEPAYDKLTITQICTDASEKERLSAKSESSVIQLKKLRLLDQMVKEEKNRRFEAVVTRVKPFGIYFDILELMYEGFLHISDLDNDYFLFDDKKLQLVGRHHGFIYHAGDPVSVMVKRIDFIMQEATWDLVMHPTANIVNKKKRE